MREHRIPFMGPLVKEILTGRKTVTRRPVRDGGAQAHCSKASLVDGALWQFSSGMDGAGSIVACPYGGPGDVLAVCEDLRRAEGSALGPWCGEIVTYAADGLPALNRDGAPYGWPWQNKSLPARYCPDWAVRLRLPLVSVRPERLSAVTDDEAVREGIAAFGIAPTADGFKALWDRLYSKGEFAAARDPWVWRLEWPRRED